MATRLTRNLRLRLTDSLTADSIYNLEKLDTLGSVYVVDTTDTLRVRSKSGVAIEPNSSDIGGTGAGGSIRLGSASQPLTSLDVYASLVNIPNLVLSTGISLADQATGGTTSLALRYKSDLSGIVDTVNRILRLDLGGADRSLILGGDLSLSGGNLGITVSGNTDWTLPSNTGSAGKFLKNDGTGTLTWEDPSSGSGVYNSGSSIWTNSDGATKTISHGFGSRKILAQVFEIDNNYETVEVRVSRPDNNNIVLTSSSAPGGSGWLVVYNETV